ncbi:hypothetical protein D3C72_1478570 [compost metagenome]
MYQLRHQLAVATTDQRLQASRNFRQGKRLAQVIVSAALQAADPLLQRITRGEDQHRHVMASLPPLSQQIQTVETRQAEIENNRIVRRAFQRVFPHQTIGKPVQIKAKFGQTGLDAVAN